VLADDVVDGDGLGVVLLIGDVLPRLDDGGGAGQLGVGRVVLSLTIR
jgi:hypothetical protein